MVFKASMLTESNIYFLKCIQFFSQTYRNDQELEISVPEGASTLA